MEHEIEKRVIAMTAATRENMERETGISSSFDEEDIRKYLHEALQEIKSKRIRSDNHT
jgi:aminoglycoside phosphotransferase